MNVLQKVANVVVGLILAWLWGLREEAWRGLHNAYVSGRPVWLWILVFWVAMLSVCAVVIGSWSPGVVDRTRPMPNVRPFARPRPLLVTAVAVLAPLIVTWWLTCPCPDLDARALFPQAREIGPLSFATYATDGSASYVMHRKREERPKSPSAFAEIRFQVYDVGVEFSCGWVVYFPKGIDLSAYTSLRFMIRGGAGSERLILKAKDAHGHERALELGEKHLGKYKITAGWEEANVPFALFGNVDFRRMENISLASNGRLHDDLMPRTVFVGDFQFVR